MFIAEYRTFFDELIRHTERYIGSSCKLTGSYQRVLSGEADPHFINDYRCYAIIKSTKTLKSIRALLEAGAYEDALILSRTMLECYLSQRYFDENFDMDTIRDMILTPKAISEGNIVYRNGSLVFRDTSENVDFTLRSPLNMTVGKDKSYFFELYNFLCEKAHCNISQITSFLNESGELSMYTEADAKLAHYISLFVFSKLFESTVLLESNRFDDPSEEEACTKLFRELTVFLYERLSVYTQDPASEVCLADKDAKKTAKLMRNSLKEQLGRVEKDFVVDLEKQNKETSIEKTLRPVLLESERPSAFFEDLRSRGKLDPKYIELKMLIDVPQNPKYHPEGDVWVHTMQAIDRAAKYRNQTDNPYAYMLLVLCHDLGKPKTTTISPEGVIHSIGHEIKGVEIARRFLDRITNSEKIKNYVLGMIPLHMKPSLYAAANSSVKATNKMFSQAVSPKDLVYMAKADKDLPAEAEEYIWNRYRIFMNEKGEED